ncbi:MAG: FHA domain-containing protein [Bdellovibrionota bacterium]|nr:FHA domain-containing protein [Bdellovibrionota bacterium]
MSIVLLIKGPQSTESIEIQNGTFTLGRSRKSDIKVDDDQISGNHISITLRDSSLSVQDNESTNGTFLNGNKLDSQEVSFGINDEIQIGKTYISLDKTSLNAAELKIFTEASKDKAEMKFIKPNTEIVDTSTNSKNGEESQSEIDLINFSIDLGENNADEVTSLDLNDSEPGYDIPPAIRQDKSDVQNFDPDKTYRSSHIHILKDDKTKNIEVTETMNKVDVTDDESRTNYIMDVEELEKEPDRLTLVKKPEVKKVKTTTFSKKNIKGKEKTKKKGLFSKLFKKS